MRRILVAAFLLAASVLAAAQSAAPAAAVKDLAPTGQLRAAINLVNTVLVQRDPATGKLNGISVELAQELARRLGVPLEYVIFEGAGKEFDSAGGGTWDIGFFAIDPRRSDTVDFTAPYVEFDGGYMVRVGSPVRTLADVDRLGTRIAVGQGSVYDLYLTSKLKNAELIRVQPASLSSVVETFTRDQLEVAAFIKIPLAQYVKSHPKLRLVRGSFMDIDQAIATPKGKGLAGRKYLAAFVEDMKDSGFVEDLLRRSGATDVSVAPAARSHVIPPAAQLKCELLPPSHRSDDTKVVTERIGPREGALGPTGNTYFLMPRAYKYVMVHLQPMSSDVAPYLVKLITRYADDTIYEPVVETIYPKAGSPQDWGPLEVMPREVPDEKIGNMFNVKVQSNYALEPRATGFSYTVSVEGCD
ncbi:MAG TPA: transporter substrate-binding domain-containing protein [Terriglobales bacterium]|nr:transporter substrate-binding domain-containing protein [Terriglobales bacterium]